MNNLCKISENFNICENIPLAEKTTFKVGGNARFYACPKNTEELCELFKICKENDFPFFVLGGGSNLVINDNGLEKLVISTEKLDKIELLSSGSREDCLDVDGLGGDSSRDDSSKADSVFVSCQAGCTMENFVNFCVENSFSGAEFFAGLPGTCGGACYMNARCYGVSVSEILSRVFYIGSDFLEHEYIFDEKDWDYKKSPFQSMIKDEKCLVIEKVVFELKKGEKDKIKKGAESYIADRTEKGHFKFPSAGSVFKNNHDFGKPSGKIIDEVGLRELKVGGAQVAPWHGNFIINTGNASAKDIRTLVEKIKKEVLEKTGFSLECEILFID